jgi:hypothetical protein
VTKKTILAVLATTMMIAVTFTGCLGSSSGEGWTQDDLLIPDFQVEDNPSPVLPTPLSSLTFPYSYRLVWTISEVYELYGGISNISLENTGTNTIYIYRFGVSWVNSTINSTRDTSVFIQSGETQDLGMIFFRSPTGDSGHYEIHIWLCVSNAGETKWHDYGKKVGTTRSCDLVPRLTEENNCTVEKNPANYFDKVNEKVIYGAVEAVTSEIRAECPLDHSINQIVGAFEWVRDNIVYVADQGTDYWQSAGETLDKGTGDCEDQAILITSIFGALGLNGRVNIIEYHAFATVFVTDSLSGLADVEEVIRSMYWTDLPICYLHDDMGYWLVTDTTGFFYTGGLPAKSCPMEGSTLDAWTFENTSYLVMVDATGQTGGFNIWPF